MTSKAIQGEEIFKDKDDYRMYLDLVRKYKSQHKFRLYSYCLLPERLELLIETGDDLPAGHLPAGQAGAGASISDIMHDLNSLYTKYFNGRYQKKGHLFESRFRSVLVEKAQYLLQMTRQIHLAQPKEYPYSSYHIYIANARVIASAAKQSMLDAEIASSPSAPRNDSSGLDLSEEVKEVLNFLKSKDDPNAYEKYVLEGDKNEIKELEKSLRRGQVLGSETFRETVKHRVEEHVEELKEAASPARPSRLALFFIGGLVLLVSATSVYLYVSKAKVQTRYSQLLKEKEREFAEKTRFENRSPLALTELDGTAWRVDMVALPADNTRAVLHDTVYFAEGLFRSERAAGLGFKPARYTVLVRPGGLTTWEVLLNDGRGGTMTWRGDWQGDIMKGVSRHAPAGKNPQVFSFYSVGWSYQPEAGQHVVKERFDPLGGAR